MLALLVHHAEAGEGEHSRDFLLGMLAAAHRSRSNFGTDRGDRRDWRRPMVMGDPHAASAMVERTT